MTIKTYETKSATDIGAEMDEFMRTFEAFKAGNDRRLADIERRGGADPLTSVEVERINRRLDELTLRQSRPQIAGSPARTGVSLQHKAAFEGYVRGGETANLREIEAKSLSVGSGPDGGYLVPAETEAAVMLALKSVSPIRAIAGVRTVSGSVYKKPFSISGSATGWAGETAARTETTSPTLAELSFPTMELYAMPAATQTLLDDSAVNIDEWIAEEVRDAFAQQEGTAFVTGNGTNKPRGFTDYPKIANASWSWGNIGYVASGADGAFASSSPSDALLNLAYAPKQGYRANGRWVMNRKTESVIRKFKDDNGNYIWQPGTAAGQPATIFGYAVTESEDMPDIASNSTSIAFGDFARGYLIVDRVGIGVLRDPYSAKPYVLFYTTKRVGGGVQDFDAIKFMKFGVS